MSQTVTARYDYRDASGKRLATKLRLGPVKDFRWVAVKDGKEVNGLGGMSQSDLPFYKVEALANAAPDAFVYYCEGEKDADNLTALGVVAVTSPEGAGATKLPKERFEALRGRHVVLLPDNDKPGREYMERVAELLRDVAASVRTLHLPGLGEKEDVSDWIARGGTAEELNRLADDHGPDMGRSLPSDVRPGCEIADSVLGAIRRFVVLPEASAVACTLWLLHTHAFEASEDFTPYLAIFSPTRASGKTTLLDVLAALAAEPLRSDSASSSALFRSVDCGRGVGKPSGRVPSVFLDELDTVFGTNSKSESAEGMRGFLNSGFKRDGAVLRCEGDSNLPRRFATWSPKVLAGIGRLPDTVSDRSIPIRMARATREELQGIEPARGRTLSALSSLRQEMEDWGAVAVPRLRGRAEPYVGLSARQDDIWGPLLNIADDLGGDWPAVARKAAVEIHSDDSDSTDGRDPGVALLADLRELFTRPEYRQMIQSSQLAMELAKMEDRPWPEWRNGTPITVNGIARLLRPFGIEPRKERVGLLTVRAYFAAECTVAFTRYLPETATTATPGTVMPSVPVVPVVPVATGGGYPPSFAPDPEGLEPLPF